MIKIGLKLWNVNIDNYLPIVKDLYKDNIFDYIELYIVPENFNTLKYWKKLEIPFDIHAPHSAHNMNLADNTKRQYNYNLYLETKKFADELNARFIILHGGIDGDYKEVALQIKNFNDSRCLIENKPYKVLKNIKAKKYIGTNLKEIAYIINNAKCGFCLDVGHAICSANSMKVSPYQLLEKFSNFKPNKIHLSDIDINTEFDEHLSFGSGNLDFYKLKNILTSVNDITIETKKQSKENLNDFVEDANFLRSIFK